MMTRSFHILIALALCLSFASPTLAQSGKGKGKPGAEDERPKEKRTPPNPSPQVAKGLMAAQTALQENKTETAKRELDMVAKRKGLKPHEQAMIYQFYGFLENQRENPNKAIQYFKRAIALDVLALGQQYSLEWNVAQLEMMGGNFEGALVILREWFKKTRRKGSPVTPNGNNYYVLALCYMNLEVPNVKRALRPAQLAVDQTDEPQENWLRLLGSIYYQLGKYEKMAGVLETLIEEYGKGEYFKQLSGAYAESGQDKKAIAVMQLAYKMGVLSSDRDLIQLARMYLYHEIPIHAAVVLEKGIAEGVVTPDITVNQLLSDAYLAARETNKSFAPLEDAAGLSDDGDLYVRLGQAYVGKQKWKEADAALGKGLAKGKLKDAGNAHLLRGIARMNLRSWGGAVASFNAAGRFEKVEDAADQYKRYLKQRRKQVEALRKG
jgi:tetratricopeptide (TPR) repeat protein